MTIDVRGASRVAIADDPSVQIADIDAALELLTAVCFENGCNKLILPKERMSEACFDLRTGLLGEILQKYTNYRLKLAIIGDFSGYTSRALRDFIRESNRGGQVLFLPDISAAVDALHNL